MTQKLKKLLNAAFVAVTAPTVLMLLVFGTLFMWPATAILNLYSKLSTTENEQ